MILIIRYREPRLRPQAPALASGISRHTPRHHGTASRPAPKRQILRSGGPKEGAQGSGLDSDRAALFADLT